MLFNNESIAKIRAGIHRGDFYAPENTTLFLHICSIYAEHGSCDLNALRNSLVISNDIEKVGDLDSIAECLSIPQDLERSIKSLQDLSKLRRLEQLALTSLKDLKKSQIPVDEKVAKMEVGLTNIVEHSANTSASMMSSDIEAVTFDGNTYTSTGYVSVDDKIYGLGGGDMIVVAGRPSSGKSCFLMNIATNLGLRKEPVACFSLEMPRVQLQQRMLCALGKVDLKKALQNKLTKAEQKSIDRARQLIQESAVYIDDDTHLTPQILHHKLSTLVKRHGVKAAFIDYLQLMRNGDGSDPRVEVTNISKSIKCLAGSLQIPIVVASQLNRQPEGRDNGEPRVSDLRESGSIEQDADIVMLIHRPGMYASVDTGLTNVIVGKNRRGETGTIPLMFLNKYTLFIETPVGDEYEANSERPEYRISPGPRRST